jgi:hypothetical protein
LFEKGETVTEEDKRKFDALETLRNAAWTSFNERRPYEWKVCLALWTGLSLFIGAVATRKVPGSAFAVAVIVTITAIIIGLNHYRWIAGIERANGIDKMVFLEYWDAMDEIVNFRLTDETREVIREWGSHTPRGKQWMGHWSHSFQIWITAILAVSLSFITWCRAFWP